MLISFPRGECRALRRGARLEVVRARVGDHLGFPRVIELGRFLGARAHLRGGRVCSKSVCTGTQRDRARRMRDRGAGKEVTDAV